MGLIKYLHIGRISFKNNLAYKTDFLVGSLFIALIIFILINLWQTMYADRAVIEGFTITMMIWYLVMTESIVTSPGRVIEQMGDEIRSGDIAQKLNKPYNYVLFHYAESMAKSAQRFVLTFLFGGIVTLLLIGPLTFNLNHFFPILLVVILALTLHFTLMALISVFALWLEDSKSMHFIYQKVVFVLGGMLLPLDIFPDWLASIGKSLPFSFIAYLPAKLFVGFNWNDFLILIAKQIGWILIFVACTIIVYRISFKRISINGG